MNFEDNEDYATYIRRKNLGLDTVEKIVSFFGDKVHCPEDWWFKKSVVKHVYGEKFSEVWPLVIKELEKSAGRG